MNRYSTVALILLSSFLLSCGSKVSEEKTTMETKAMSPQTSKDETATFGAGCYWCIEAVLQQVDGVTKIESGFMGGHVDDPSYQAVCNETTGHAEVVQLHFDPTKVSYRELLGWFWKLHDPTTLNRQGNDVGTQYRSAIYFHSDEQEAIAKDSKAKADKSGHFDNPIVTEITKADTFWKAKEDHQNYYRLNKQKNPYCQMISRKLMKLGLDY